MRAARVHRAHVAVELWKTGASCSYASHNWKQARGSANNNLIHCARLLVSFFYLWRNRARYALENSLDACTRIIGVVERKRMRFKISMNFNDGFCELLTPNRFNPERESCNHGDLGVRIANTNKRLFSVFHKLKSRVQLNNRTSALKLWIKVDSILFWILVQLKCMILTIKLILNIKC